MVDEINQTEFDAVEKEVNAKLAKEAAKGNEDLAKKIREDVEKEYKQKAEISKLQETLARQQEEIKKAQEEANKARLEADERSKKLEESFKKEMTDMLARKQGIISGNDSPFNAPTPTNNENLRNVNGKMIDITKLDHKAIEEESRQKFMDFLGIKDQVAREQWGRDPRDR